MHQPILDNVCFQNTHFNEIFEINILLGTIQMPIEFTDYAHCCFNVGDYLLSTFYDALLFLPARK
jgi:hypothetical protein